MSAETSQARAAFPATRGERCARISYLTAINDQLDWSVGRSGECDPLVIAAPEVVLLELTAATR